MRTLRSVLVSGRSATRQRKRNAFVSGVESLGWWTVRPATAPVISMVDLRRIQRIRRFTGVLVAVVALSACSNTAPSRPDTDPRPSTIPSPSVEPGGEVNYARLFTQTVPPALEAISTLSRRDVPPVPETLNALGSLPEGYSFVDPPADDTLLWCVEGGDPVASVMFANNDSGNGAGDMGAFLSPTTCAASNGATARGGVLINVSPQRPFEMIFGSAALNKAVLLAGLRVAARNEEVNARLDAAQVGRYVLAQLNEGRDVTRAVAQRRLLAPGNTLEEFSTSRRVRMCVVSRGGAWAVYEASVSNRRGRVVASGRTNARCTR